LFRPKLKPQESVLWPRTHVIYAEDEQERQEIFALQRVMYHLFADDLQGFTSTEPLNARSTS